MTRFRLAALSLLGATPGAAQVSAPITTVDIPASTILPSDGDLARSYLEKAQSDPDNAQAWTACAAAATKRAERPAEADDYAVQMAKVLKLIVPDPSRSPCEDAISPPLWAAAGGPQPAPRAVAKPVPPAAAERIRLQEEAAKADAAERARLTELNQAAAARAKADTDKILADKQAAALARQAYQAAQAQYDTDKARVDKARAAQVEYDRQMREYRAKYGK
ncbi:hypothetical protein U1701_10340 [Sphingomonas sp. PB2P19]|uniref:hypothetical protein n=1 Tax=Sphingomonas rhamnosi TaxID=3096156 RepID=UPI002FCC7861